MIILVDSDVLIHYLRGKIVARELLERHCDEMAFSVVTVGEIWAGVKGEREAELVSSLSSVFPVLPVTGDIAKKAGFYVARYGRSHGVVLLDALIAATAWHEKCTLMTLNVRHYPMFPGLEAAWRVEGEE